MSEAKELKAISEAANAALDVINAIKDEIKKVIIGQVNMIDKLLLGIICDGHVLLEGVPGLAKTLTVKSLAGTIDASYKRIQFTPDLLPADIIGTEIYDIKNSVFLPKQGPIFANIILADEVSPDTCRLWDVNTNEKLDKDRFRRDLGDLVEGYEEVLARLNK